ncbi:MAG: DUF3467 domain-containing protein [Acidobacteriota bacterium]
MDAKIIAVKGGDIKITNTPQQITFYSNVAQIIISNEEVIIRFGLREPENPQSGTGVATAYLGLAHAKRLASALGRSINQYEKTFGEIIADPLGKLTPEQIEKIGISKDAK